MACVSGTNIVNDGLVFHFDLENTEKSWKDKPTSNLRAGEIMSSNYQGNSAIANNNYNLTAPDGSTGWSSFTISQVNSNHRCGQFSYTSQPANTTYTYSIELFNPGPDTFQIFIDGSFGTGHTNIPLGYSKWSLVHTTGTLRIQSIWFGSANQTTGVTYTPPRLIYFKNYQVEVGDIATKFTSGVRLDTASIIDISPSKSTITAANLTYRQDDTPTFDGTNDYLIAPTIGTLGAMSIDTWVYSNENRYASIAGDFSTITDSVGLRLNWRLQGDVWVEFGEAGISSSVATSVNVNSWYNIVGMATNNDTVKLYINGQHVGTTSTTRIFTGGLPFYIGRGDFDEYFYGEISQVKVYNKALSAQEIKQNFEATRGRYNV